ncbi:AimR family lysis-lysogeny pheromone receptor [Bacillus velezensis]|uniref:AimR family lysis-lysogeny pheromone receptor n=1 Tax=Bacillus velezensis TaxID=492670 RepID=UPI0024AFAA50|nr:AimR family lysis-lysogeny pheromone receptor [Bacillus velezensis]MEC1940348.1 AimR family lysis-lysogeny pheromone receptor [Bacillus velezensis]WHM14853.1 AimR family lysis-lysogeny pheromone receptor [Bacillus velezensis]
MQSIVDEVIEMRKEMDLNVRQLAESTGIKSSCLYDFEDDGKIGFRKILRLSQYFFKGNYHEKMRDWCLKLPTTEATKQAFEYAAVKRDVGLLGKLIEISQEDEALVPYVRAYTVLHDYMTYKTNFNQLSSQMSKVKAYGNKELNILKRIYKCVSFYYHKDFYGITREAEEVVKDLKKMNTERSLFYKECYLYRLSEVLAPAYLSLNEIELCSYHANVLIKGQVNLKHQSDGYYYLGMINLEKDKEKSLEYFQKSLEVMKLVGEPVLVKETQYNLELAKIYFKHREGRGIPDLSLFEKELILGGDADFLVYFKYVQCLSKDRLHQGYIHFHTGMNYLFASLIADDLMMIGEDRGHASVLKNLKIKSRGEIFYEKDFINCFSFRSGFCCVA